MTDSNATAAAAPHAPARVLVIPPMYGGSLPVARYCAQGLRDAGQVVEIFEAPAFHSAFTALGGLRVTSDRLEYLENSFLQVIGQAILAKVETFAPDLVLALAQAPLSRQALKRLRRDNVPTAMWFVEDYRLFTYWRTFAPLYDFFAVIQKEPFLSELSAIGQENGMYLPLAAQPSFHQPVELSAVDRRTYGAEVSFLGAGYPNRREAFRKLTHLGLRIWGSDWEGDTTLARFVQRGGARIEPEEAVKIFNATAVNLNLHSSVQARELVVPGDFVNPRTFEVAGCGAFQLVDRRGLLPELFTGDEMATFGSMEELEKKIAHFMAHPEERAAYAERARTRVLAEHTYAHRMRSLLDFVRSRREGWPAGSEATNRFPEEFPEELKDDFNIMASQLDLPPDAPFEDVVWAVRARGGELSGLETAVLFLDEWRKQYKRKN